MFVKELVPFHWLLRLSSSRCYHDLSTGQEVEKQSSVEDRSFNREVAAIRGHVEHAIGGLKHSTSSVIFTAIAGRILTVRSCRQLLVDTTLE